MPDNKSATGSPGADLVSSHKSPGNHILICVRSAYCDVWIDRGDNFSQIYCKRDGIPF
jgi:hypothetical protein